MKSFHFVYLLFFILFSCAAGDDVEITKEKNLPFAPTDLVGELTSENQITLAWVDNSTNETGFKIERKEGDNQFLEIGTVNSNITSYLDNGLNPNSTYTYRVYAYNEDGNSLTYSNLVVIANYYLLERIIDSDGAAHDFSYNGDKLDRITIYGGGYREFTYSGDLIISIQDFTSNGESDGYIENYEYENDKMIRRKAYHNSELVMDYLISYPNSNQLKVEDLLDDFISLLQLDSKGNIIKVDQESDGEMMSASYTYDNKNGPFKNIKGVNFFINMNGLFDVSAQNNMLTMTITASVQGDDYTDRKEYNYTYNDKDYPTLMECTQIITLGNESFTKSYEPYSFSYK